MVRVHLCVLIDTLGNTLLPSTGSGRKQGITLGEKSTGEAERQIKGVLPYGENEMSNRKRVAPVGNLLEFSTGSSSVQDITFGIYICPYDGIQDTGDWLL